MRAGQGRNPGHLGDNAGDLSWQQDPDRPPACRVPRNLPEHERRRRHARFDVRGRRVSDRDWEILREGADMCRSCPLLLECRAYALDPEHKAEGVWGGLYFGSAMAAHVAVRDGKRVPQQIPSPADLRKRRRRWERQEAQQAPQSA
jgi:hypothetical protein